MLRHPHHYTISLLKHLLDKADHTLFPQERLEEMKQEYMKLSKDHSISQRTIEATIARLGKEIWPYQEALEELYRRHGKKREAELMHAKLSPALQGKYVEFIAKGGSLSDFRRGSDTEVYFTPEEKFEIGQVVVDVGYAVLKEIASACRLDRKDECESVIDDHKEKLKRIEKKLEVLRALAGESEQWRLEIEDKIKTFEDAFGYLARTFHEEDLNGAIDYYQGIIESPEFS